MHLSCGQTFVASADETRLTSAQSLVARLHEKRIDFHAMVSLQDTFGDIEEVDEDGNPYFKALDWKSLSASGIGGSGILARPVRKLVVSGWNKSS